MAELDSIQILRIYCRILFNDGGIGLLSIMFFWSFFTYCNKIRLNNKAFLNTNFEWKGLISSRVFLSFRYLVPRDMSVGQFIHILSNRLRLTPGKALFIFVKNTLPQTGKCILCIHNNLVRLVIILDAVWLL
jgi:hypothetical protein